jgi:hypothetical protein
MEMGKTVLDPSMRMLCVAVFDSPQPLASTIVIVTMAQPPSEKKDDFTTQFLMQFRGLSFLPAL